MESLNYITVNESAQREITATGAKLAVCISGQSLFTGGEALKKAAEVAECVTRLSSCGIAEEKVQIKNIYTKAGSGFLVKSSSATYNLEVACDSMELLGAAVKVIASLKNSRIDSMAWNYTDIEKVKRELLEEAVRSANVAAKTIVSALNIALAGVHRLKYDLSGLDDELEGDLEAFGGRASFADADFALSDSSDNGLSLSHTANVIVKVFAEFLVKTD